MRNLSYELKRYALIYFLFVKNSIMAQMEYRANFFMQIVSECAALASRLLYVVVVYQTGLTLNGLPTDSILLFMGTYFIMTFVYVFFFVNNFFEFQQHVRNGTLDWFMTKPISLQFMVSLRKINFGMSIPDLVLGIILVGYGWSRLNIEVSAWNMIGYLLLTLGGAIMVYVVFMFPQILVFWLGNTVNLYQVGAQLWESNTMPMSIYNKAMQTIGTIVFPIFLISNFSPLFILNQLTLLQTIWGFVAPVIFLVLLRLLFKKGLKRYASAG